MESRIREGRNKLIDAFVQLVRHENNDPVAWCYPPDGLDEDLRRSVPRFAFPFRENFQSSNIDYFTFVLTALDGKFRFGFCRMSAGSESTLCLISSYPWFEIFYKILNHLSDAQNSSSDKLRSLLEDLYDIDPSIAGKKSLTFNVPGSQNSVTFDYPNPNKLPSIPESRNLTEYYNAIDGYNMLIIFASMLFERRIIVTSRKLSRLTACVYGATSLIYPLNWQHIFIPVLPAHLLDYISAPMPYLIGVHSSLLESVRSAEIDDAVIVDADTSHVQSTHNDLASLPSSIVSALKKSLKVHRKGDKHCSLTGDKLSTAFLNAMVALIGGYRAALVERDGQLSFDRHTFEHSRTSSSSMQTFLQKILQSQSFERFIEERVTFVKYRKGFSDVFEEAIDAADAKHQGGGKHKANNLKAEKMFGDISKKVRKTSAKTISSVKKKLDFKKNQDNVYGDGKAIPYPEEEVEEEVSRVVAVVSVPVLAVIQPSENATDNQITLVVGPSGVSLPDTPSILRRQQGHPPSSRTSTINRRHSFIMSKADDEEDGQLRMGLERNGVLKNCSFDDLTNRDAEEKDEEDVVTLSSCSLESCHDAESSKTLPVFTDVPHQDISNLPLVQPESNPTDASVQVSAEPSRGITGPLASNAVDFSDEDDIVGEIDVKANAKVNRVNKDPVLEFPSVRELRRALQPTNAVKRRAVISVQELPNVRQIIRQIEATGKPHEKVAQEKVAQQAPGKSHEKVAQQAPGKSHEKVAQQALFRLQEMPRISSSPCRPQVKSRTIPFSRQEVLPTAPRRPQELVFTIPFKSREAVVAAPCKSSEFVVAYKPHEEDHAAVPCRREEVVITTTAERPLEVVFTIPIKSQEAPCKSSEMVAAATLKSSETGNTAPLKSSEMGDTVPLRSSEMVVTTPLKSSEMVVTTPLRSSEMGDTVPLRSSEMVVTTPLRSSEMVVTTPLKSSEVVVTTPLKSQEEDEHTTKTNADDISTFVLRRTDVLSLLDQKNRTSLTRKQAIRVTGPRVKKPSSGSDVTDGGDTTDATHKDDNHPSSARPNSERYQDLLDLVKTERNSAFLDVNNPFEDDYGCLLRVSTKSASMRQLNLIEQRYSAASLKRSLPVSVAARDSIQRTRTAIYDSPTTSDTESKPVARNNSKLKSSCRNALYVPFQPKSATETDSDSETIPGEFARRLNFEILSGDSSTSSESSTETSRSPEFPRATRSFKQSYSFDGVIIDESDVAEMPPVPNERTFPGRTFIPGDREEAPRTFPGRSFIPGGGDAPGSSSDDLSSSSDSSTVFGEMELCVTEPSLEQLRAVEIDGCNGVSAESDA